MGELTGGDRCFGDVFADAYAWSEDVGIANGARPVPACSGCPGCRRLALVSTEPAVRVVRTASAAPPGRLAAMARDDLLVVHDEPDWLYLKGPKLLAALVEAGIGQVYLDHKDDRVQGWIDSDRSPYVAVDLAPPGFPAFPRPSVVWRPMVTDPRWRRPAGSLRVIVVPTATPAPDKPAELLHVWWGASRLARDLIQEL